MKFTSQYSLAKRLTSTLCLLPTLLLSSGAYSFAQSFEALSYRRRQPPIIRPSGPLSIVSPRFGSTVRGDQVNFKVKVSRRYDFNSVKVRLNGHSINAQVTSSECGNEYCTMGGTISQEDGLKSGENRMLVSVKGWEGRSGDISRTKFRYRSTSLGDSNGGVNYYEPDSLGISTDIGAQTGWVTISTGYQANVADPVASFPPPQDNGVPVSPSIPYPDRSFGDACSAAFRAVMVDRTNPSTLQATACAANIPDLMANLANAWGKSLGSSNLVIAATSPSIWAPKGFDTTPLGGRAYPANVVSDAQLYPEEYMIIGVPGATPGTAHESYDVATGPDTPYQYAPFIKGTLMNDGSNYNYLPSDQREFQVISTDNPQTTSIQVGGQRYLPPTTLSNGFWLLVLDRELLQPINYPYSQWTNCSYDTGTQTCGGMFDVSDDIGVAALGRVLSSISPRNLVFLVAEGCPFYKGDTNQNLINFIPLANPLANLGGVGRALPALVPSNGGYGPSCTYSLVSVNDLQHTDPLTDKLALSAGQFVQQKQIGAIHGYVARGKDGLFDVAAKDQMTSDGNGGFKGQVDFRFSEIASQQNVEWPYTDTPGHLAAYHDLSYQILNAIGETGSYTYDLRYFFTQEGKRAKLSNNLSVLKTAKPSSWDIAATDFNAVRDELVSEVNNADNATEYLTGDDLNGGIYGIMNDSSTPLWNNMLGVASAITSDQDKAKEQTVDLSSMLSMLSGVTATLSVAPGVGPAFGVISGGLGIGATVAASNEGNIPSSESSYDVTLDELENNASAYITDLQKGFAGAVENILTDSAKLSAAGALVNDSDSGWSLNLPKAIELQSNLVAAASRQMWLAVMPNLFGVRYFFNMAQSNPKYYGSWVQHGAWNPATCETVYPSVPTSSWTFYPVLTGANNFDTFILGEGSKPGNGSDTTVSDTLSSLLTQPETWSTTINGITQYGLNLPSLVLFTNSNLPYAPGAYYDSSSTCTVKY